MRGSDAANEALAVLLARECVYRFLAAALGEPDGDRLRLLRDGCNQELARAAGELLHAEAAGAAMPLGFGELPPAQLDLGPLLADVPASVEAWRAEQDGVFGLVLSPECPPYEMEYHPASETFFRAQQLADVAGFYRAFGLEMARAAPERPDHLAVELEFMAFLLRKERLARASVGEKPAAAARARMPVPQGWLDAVEQAGICAEAGQAFFQDHLAWWVPSFVTGLRRKAGDGFHAAVARVLASLLPAERARLGLPAPRLPLPPAFIERPEEQAGCADCAGPP